MLKIEFRDTGGYDSMTGAWSITKGNKDILRVDQADYGQEHLDYEFRSKKAETVAKLCFMALQLHEEEI